MIEEPTKHFRAGQIVIFPTDTLYGVGCRVDSENSIKRLYDIRETPYSKPTLILAADSKQAFEYGEFDAIAKNLANAFWPGPLTVIIKAKNLVPKMIQGKLETIAVRVPNQPPVINIIKKLGMPILAPSANFHGRRAPTNFSEIDKDLLALVDYAVDLAKLDGGKQMRRKPSTLIDLTKKPFKIVRPGAISEKQIRKAFGGA
ncbi:MAG TPA: L-threonylcarbamoyladenylate synthase [Candidatus Nanoarchaeia archaeon]